MDFQQAVERLREREHVPMFVAEVWDSELDQALRDAKPEELFGGQTLKDPHMAACVVAGLHLWNDNFEAGHNLCQGIQTPTGSYWHGLCHRREGHRGEGLGSNLANAKYWFRQVGRHPVFEEVYRSALGVLQSAGGGFRWRSEAESLLQQRGEWDPFMLVDWFGQVEDGTLSPESGRLLEQVQWREIGLLVDWCARKAIGG